MLRPVNVLLSIENISVPGRTCLSANNGNVELGAQFETQAWMSGLGHCDQRLQPIFEASPVAIISCHLTAGWEPEIGWGMAFFR